LTLIREVKALHQKVLKNFGVLIFSLFQLVRFNDNTLKRLYSLKLTTHFSKNAQKKIETNFFCKKTVSVTPILSSGFARHTIVFCLSLSVIIGIFVHYFSQV